MDIHFNLIGQCDTRACVIFSILFQYENSFNRLVTYPV